MKHIDDWSRVTRGGKAALAASGTFVSIGLFAMASALPVMGQSLRSEPNAALYAQLAGAVVPPMFAIAAPLAGRVTARYGVRATMIGALTLFLIGGAGPSLVSSLPLILLLRMVLALGVAGAFTAGMTGISQLPDDQKPRLLGLVGFIGGAICIPLFPLVGMLAADNWRLAFLMHLTLAPVLLLAHGLPRTAPPPPTLPVSTAKAGGMLGGVPAGFILIVMLVGLAMAATSIYAPFYLGSIGIANPAHIGQILGASALCSLIGSGSYSFLHRHMGKVQMVMIALGTIGAGAILSAQAHDAITATAGLGLMSIGLASFSASGYAYAIDAAGSTGGAAVAMGAVTFALYGSQIAFPALSIIVGSSWGPAMVYVIVGLFMFLSILLMHYRSTPYADAFIGGAE